MRERVGAVRDSLTRASGQAGQRSQGAQFVWHVDRRVFKVALQFGEKMEKSIVPMLDGSRQGRPVAQDDAAFSDMSSQKYPA